MHLVVCLCLYRPVLGQANNIIVSYGCTDFNGAPSECDVTKYATPNNEVNLTIAGSCTSGHLAVASQYSIVNGCVRLYDIEVRGFESANTCPVSHYNVGFVEAASYIRVNSGQQLMGEQYHTEDCNGNIYESGPGSFLGFPC